MNAIGLTRHLPNATAAVSWLAVTAAVLGPLPAAAPEMTLTGRPI
jgi:hypothetical protein